MPASDAEERSDIAKEPAALARGARTRGSPEKLVGRGKRVKTGQDDAAQNLLGRKPCGRVALTPSLDI
jgi:hypothetical protein